MRVTLIAPVFVSAFYSYISFLANIEKLLAVGIKNNRKGCQVYKSRMQSVPDGKD